MAEDKGFKPTQKKLKEARKRGQVLKSPLITQTLTLCIGGALIWQFAGSTWVRLKMLIEYCFVHGFQAPTECLSEGFGLTIQFGGSCLVCMALGSILGECLQLGFKIEFAALAARADRLSIGAGLKRLAAQCAHSWAQALKVAALAAIGAWLGWSMLPDVLRALPLSSGHLQVLLTESMQRMFLAAVLILGLGAIVEYVLRRRQFLRELSMSLDDLRRENKEDEGDPHLRSARKALHESLMHQDIVSRVRKSKVIVVRRS